MKLRNLVAVGLVLAVVARSATAPAEISVTTATKLEIMAAGKSAGSVWLRAGERLQLVEVEDSTAIVHYRNLKGRVPLGHTDAVNRVAVPATAPLLTAAAPSASLGSAVVSKGAASSAPYVPSGAIERALAGKLVALEKAGLRPRATARLAGAKFFGIYFSASWCGPCRAFTPELVDAYGKIRALYPEFEVVFVSSDQSPAEMTAYMRDDQMPWPALAWDARKSTRDITRYAGSGIPCLVLVDETGKVLADSYRWGRYVGPSTVLDDTWKILREYRKKNPRPKG
ncbi:MAG: redoxin domain-containing protein [Opitutaceae bacterium]|nr:redoxin domain-containing protein [Opitutaceae bacterium]